MEGYTTKEDPGYVSLTSPVMLVVSLFCLYDFKNDMKLNQVFLILCSVKMKDIFAYKKKLPCMY